MGSSINDLMALIGGGVWDFVTTKKRNNKDNEGQNIPKTA